MFRHLQLLASVCLTIILGSCNSIPDNVKYIPQNAIVVLGIHTDEVGKKIAWNAITGSKLLDELKQRQLAGNASIDPEAMGIKLNSVTYIYLKADKRFQNGNRVTALIPLEDEAKWDGFVRKSFPDASIKTTGQRKQAMLANGMYAGWTNNLLIVMNTLEMPGEYDVSRYLSTTKDTASNKIIEDTLAGEISSPTPTMADETQLLAEMENAFTIKKENSLKENKRFTKLETAGHDLTIWVNYDEIMGVYGSQGIAGMGLNLSNVLWKDAAFAAGFDFEKGKITGDMLYYSPEEMKDVAKEMGKESASKELIDMLPLAQPDMAFSWHLSPEGLKGTLDKMGLLGFVNLALSQQNLTADEVLSAITGDMAFVVSDISIKKDSLDTVAGYRNITGTDSMVRKINYTPEAKYLYVLKIGKKENFNRLLQLAVSSKALTNNGNNIYKLTGGNALTLVVNDKYLVCASSVSDANSFLQGGYKNNKKDKHLGSTLNHPIGVYINLQSMFNGIKPLDMNTKDSLMLAETKNIFARFEMYGGEFNNGRFKYNMAFHFVNKDENALLQLINYAVKMDQIKTLPEPLL